MVVIPAFNEEKTIATVIGAIPRDALDEVQVLVIDDGSADGTVSQAKRAGADRVISFDRNRGLAVAFRKGLEEALSMGADIVVNIDADGQYESKEIPSLIRPIVEGYADLVLGSRFKGWIEDMPVGKRIGNLLATKATSVASGLAISDSQTGFRAFSREAALKLNILSDYTYVQETIIQAARKGLRIVEVPCIFRKREGRSRLISSIFDYAWRAGLTVLRTYRDYKPLRAFLFIGGLLFSLGVIIGLRVLIHFFVTGTVTPYLPSAVLTAVLLIVGFQVIVLGLIADMIGGNRRLMEEILYKLRKRELEE